MALWNTAVFNLSAAKRFECKGRKKQINILLESFLFVQTVDFQIYIEQKLFQIPLLARDQKNLYDCRLPIAAADNVAFSLVARRFHIQ